MKKAVKKLDGEVMKNPFDSYVLSCALRVPFFLSSRVLCEPLRLVRRLFFFFVFFSLSSRARRVHDMTRDKACLHMTPPPPNPPTHHTTPPQRHTPFVCFLSSPPHQTPTQPRDPHQVPPRLALRRRVPLPLPLSQPQPQPLALQGQERRPLRLALAFPVAGCVALIRICDCDCESMRPTTNPHHTTRQPPTGKGRRGSPSRSRSASPRKMDEGNGDAGSHHSGSKRSASRSRSPEVGAASGGGEKATGGEESD